MKSELKSVRYAARGGFSLLEISLVVVLIGLLTAGAAVALLGRSQAVKVRITKTSMNLLKSQIESHMTEGNGSPPASLDILLNKGFIEKGNMNDAWKQQFYYQPTGMNGRNFTLISSGPDRQLDTADDIDVWTMDLTSDE